MEAFYNSDCPTEEMCLALVREEGVLIRDVPERLRTKRVIETAAANVDFDLVRMLGHPFFRDDEEERLRRNAEAKTLVR